MDKDNEKLELLKEAIEILVEGSKLGLIKAPKFKPSDEMSFEDSLFDEIFNVVNNYKKNRIKNFLNYLSLPESVKSSQKIYFKQVKWACSFLKKNKELLKNYLKDGVFSFMLGSNWIYPYLSGDALPNKISKLGKTKPRHKSVVSSFSRCVSPRVKSNKNKSNDSKILDNLEEIIELVKKNLTYDLDKVEVKGEVDFKSRFIEDVIEEINKRFNIIIFSPDDIKLFYKVIDKITPEMRKYWEEKCKQNLKNSSTQKEGE